MLWYRRTIAPNARDTRTSPGRATSTAAVLAPGAGCAVASTPSVHSDTLGCVPLGPGRQLTIREVAKCESGESAADAGVGCGSDWVGASKSRRGPPELHPESDTSV